MNYQKQNFSDGEILQASHLNYIEEGIEEIYEEVESLEKQIVTYKIAKNTDIDKIFKTKGE